MLTTQGGKCSHRGMQGISQPNLHNLGGGWGCKDRPRRSDTGAEAS